MTRFELLIFVTGAVTLALEVLASRIMTPHFGVSLYIWSGILSITLTFLALGYRYGGKISRRLEGASLEFGFLALPLASAASIGLAAAIYPIFFPLLSRTDLVLGSFVAASLLLALPLIALSAMNPLAIAMQRDASKNGDGGAGRVFFISTVGSVAGVIATAFVFIPNITNYRTILLLGVALCAVAAALAGMSKVLSVSQKRQLLTGSVALFVVCGALFVGKDRYLKAIGELAGGQYVFDIRAEYTSMFGNIKIAEVRRRDGIGNISRWFLQDGLVQNRTTLENTSVSMYTYVLESLVHSFSPGARDVVVLGLGAGIVPRHLNGDGLNVSVVEINPKALEAATANFDFDRDDLQVHIEDARTFVRRCENAYDAAVIDLFWGDDVPDYVLTREFFRDLRRCVRPGGAVVMNSIFDEQSSEPNRRLFATIATAFPRLFLSGIPDGNFFIVGTSGAAPDKITIESNAMPKEIAFLVEFTISQFRQIPPGAYQFAEPVSDGHNIFTVLFSDEQMASREAITGVLPPHVLVN